MTGGLERRSVLILLTGGGLAAASGAFAHRAKRALTTVTWNARTQTLEVVHRLHAHDAQQALMSVSGLAHPVLSELEPRARLALYVEKNFVLTHGDGAPLALKLIGAQLDGDHVLVFQEAVLDAVPEGIGVYSTILQDVFPAQVNDVKITLGAKKDLLSFTKDDSRKTTP